MRKIELRHDNRKRRNTQRLQPHHTGRVYSEIKRIGELPLTAVQAEEPEKILHLFAHQVAPVGEIGVQHGGTKPRELLRLGVYLSYKERALRLGSRLEREEHGIFVGIAQHRHGHE